MWNFNMADVWQNIFGKIYGSTSKSGEKMAALKGIWDELNVAGRPADKRAGLLHISLMGSINRFINLAKLEEEIPKYMANIMKHKNAPTKSASPSTECWASTTSATPPTWVCPCATSSLCPYSRRCKETLSLTAMAESSPTSPWR